MSLKQQIIVIKSLSGKRQKSTGMRVPRRRTVYLMRLACLLSQRRRRRHVFEHRVDGEISFDVSHAHVQNQCVVGGRVDAY